VNITAYILHMNGGKAGTEILTKTSSIPLASVAAVQ
jgi:hypothetical protein